MPLLDKGMIAHGSSDLKGNVAAGKNLSGRIGKQQRTGPRGPVLCLGFVLERSRLRAAQGGMTVTMNEDGTLSAQQQESNHGLTPAEGLSYARFRELMNQADDLLGGGSDYREDRLSAFAYRGKTYEEAKKALEKAGFFMRASGVSVYYGNTTTAASQSVAGGEIATMGTVVDVKFFNVVED